MRCLRRDPAPGPEFLRYGGHTSCVALTHDGAAGPSLIWTPLPACARNVPLTLPKLLAPLLRSVPRHPVAMARFGAVGVLPVSLLARRFRTEEARGLLAGVAAHTILPLTTPGTGGFGQTLMMIAHAVG